MGSSDASSPTTSAKAAGRPAAFALVVGDDASDEPMFAALKKWGDESPSGAAARRAGRAFSVTVGKKPSDAEAYVDAHDNLVELLEALARVSKRGARYYSSHDFAQEYAAAAAAAADDSDANVASAAPAPAADMARSMSMPAFGQASANAPRRRSVPRKNSWLSFQDAFQAPAPGALADCTDPVISEGDEENDDAAMFF
mmetsp:Transcript_33860/g.103919  ORF Transcript_33860/g.103919 Transcript_33860/m.103919 type:complete len:199 (+) Transcript_33860:550-1146(+)